MAVKTGQPPAKGSPEPISKASDNLRRMPKDKQPLLNVLLPPRLHRRAKIRTAEEGIRLSDVVRKLLHNWLAGNIRLEDLPDLE